MATCCGNMRRPHSLTWPSSRPSPPPTPAPAGCRQPHRRTLLKTHTLPQWPDRDQARCLAELMTLAAVAGNEVGKEDETNELMAIDQVRAFIKAEIDAATRRGFEAAERMKLHKLPLDGGRTVPFLAP
jgi:hypothetical protein